MATTPEFVWGPTIDGLRLAAALDRGTYSRHDSIELALALSNESDQTISLVEVHLLGNYRFRILLQGAGAIRFTAEGERILRAVQAGDPSGRRTVSLPPGALYEVPGRVPLDRWFQLDRPGRYSVQAERKDWREGDDVLTSGTVHFEIR